MVSFRTDEGTQEALEYLAERGLSRSEAIRRALLELAERERRVALRAEVAALAADPRDRAESLRLLAEMDEIALPLEDEDGSPGATSSGSAALAGRAVTSSAAHGMAWLFNPRISSSYRRLWSFPHHEASGRRRFDRRSGWEIRRRGFIPRTFVSSIKRFSVSRSAMCSRRR